MIEFLCLFFALSVAALLMTIRHCLIRELEEWERSEYTERFINALYRSLQLNDTPSAFKLAQNYERRSNLPSLLASFDLIENPTHEYKLDLIENPTHEYKCEVCRGFIQRYLGAI